MRIVQKDVGFLPKRSNLRLESSNTRLSPLGLPIACLSTLSGQLPCQHGCYFLTTIVHLGLWFTSSVHGLLKEIVEGNHVLPNLCSSRKGSRGGSGSGCSVASTLCPMRPIILHGSIHCNQSYPYLGYLFILRLHGPQLGNSSKAHDNVTVTGTPVRVLQSAIMRLIKSSTAHLSSHGRLQFQRSRLMSLHTRSKYLRRNSIKIELYSSQKRSIARAEASNLALTRG